jgi:hypothetical protein
MFIYISPFSVSILYLYCMYETWYVIWALTDNMCFIYLYFSKQQHYGDVSKLIIKLVLLYVYIFIYLWMDNVNLIYMELYNYPNSYIILLFYIYICYTWNLMWHDFTLSWGWNNYINVLGLRTGIYIFCNFIINDFYTLF